MTNIPFSVSHHEPSNSILQAIDDTRKRRNLIEGMKKTL